MSDYQHHRRIVEQAPPPEPEPREREATTRVTPWVMGGAVALALAFVAWLLLAPSDSNMGTASKPPATASENTGSRGGVRNPPPQPQTAPDQQRGQSQDATHDSTRGSSGPSPTR